MMTRLPDMILIEAGEFVMGAVEADKFANATELPATREIVEPPFHLGRFPLTNAEWLAFRPGSRSTGEPDHPVTGVSWNDAECYLEWLRRETGDPGWRLPTEVEWEYACRAGTITIFPSGDDLGEDEANFSIDESRRFVGARRTTPVDRFPPNRWGLHDMIGNVSEWTSTPWRATHRPEEPSRVGRFVVRGGSWDGLPRLLRCSWRDGLEGRTRRDNLGFRVARSAS